MQTISGTFGVLAYAVGAVWGNYVLIYAGAGLVLAFSIVPPFFIEEPRTLASSSENPGGRDDASAGAMLQAIRPLWGFLLYAVYGMTARLGNWEIEGYWVEALCLVLTIALMAESLFRSESGLGREAAGALGFRKVLAAHAFTWVGVQTMFIYLFAFVQQRMPELGDVDMGRVVSISFLVLNAVGALVPVLVLEPITERIGRVKTHYTSLAIMALAYAGVLFLGRTPMSIYVLMGIAGIGWGAIVSLPFAIMSQKVDQGRMGLYMGLFNLSVVLPQLVASLGVGEAVSRTADKGLIFVICAATLAVSALAWTLVREGSRGETPPFSPEPLPSPPAA
jgi:hypothetical protein